MTTREKVAVLTERGLSIREIADRIGVVRNTVEYHQRRIREKAPPDSKGAVQIDIKGIVTVVSTRAAVEHLLDNGLSRTEVARRLGITKPTVTYHARRLGRPIDDRANRRYDWTAVQAYYDEGHSGRHCIQHFGMSSKTWRDATLRGVLKVRPRRTPSDEFFVREPHSRGHVKRRLLAEGLVEAHCAECGLHEWRGQSISLQLHHINGNGKDNRLDNLELLCPNCHAQTDNWAGRNRTALQAVPDEEIA